MCANCNKAAANVEWPGYSSGCRGCAVRALAAGPDFHASGLDGSLSAGYRKALALIGGDAWREVHAEVKTEAARIKALKAGA